MAGLAENIAISAQLKLELGLSLAINLHICEETGALTLSFYSIFTFCLGGGGTDTDISGTISYYVIRKLRPPRRRGGQTYSEVLTLSEEGRGMDTLAAKT